MRQAEMARLQKDADVSWTWSGMLEVRKWASGSSPTFPMGNMGTFRSYKISRQVRQVGGSWKHSKESRAGRQLDST